MLPLCKACPFILHTTEFPMAFSITSEVMLQGSQIATATALLYWYQYLKSRGLFLQYNLHFQVYRKQWKIHVCTFGSRCTYESRFTHASARQLTSILTFISMDEERWITHSYTAGEFALGQDIKWHKSATVHPQIQRWAPRESWRARGAEAISSTWNRHKHNHILVTPKKDPQKQSSRNLLYSGKFWHICNHFKLFVQQLVVTVN